MASFADPSDMVIYYDQRKVQQQLSDSGTPVTDIENNAILLALLARATEEVLAHATRGKKYTETELQALADSETSGYYLVGLCCDLAFGYLAQRRGTRATDLDQQAPAYKTALLKLQMLADGVEIFPRTGELSQEDAGTPSTDDLTQSLLAPCSNTNRAFRTLLPSRPFGTFGGSCGSCGNGC